MLLYIHGFLSSPLSHKAKLTQDFCQQQNPEIECCCPALSAYPAEAMARLVAIIEDHSATPIGLIGSSMGGYYATYLSERFNLRAVLVNPVVAPYRLMTHYVGRELKNYHSEETYRLGPAFIQQLRELEVDRLQQPDNYWLMVQTGDEVLDYAQAVDRYQQCKTTIERGGDHSFQGFDHRLPTIISFLNGSSGRDT